MFFCRQRFGKSEPLRIEMACQSELLRAAAKLQQSFLATVQVCAAYAQTVRKCFFCFRFAVPA